MASANFTDPFIRSLRPLSDGQKDYWDERVTGLVLRVSPAGKKTWSVLYRFNGRQRRLTLGSYDILGLADARTRAKAVLLSASGGVDPAAVKQEDKRSLTFADLAKEYVEHHAKLKRSGREDIRQLYGSPHKKRTGKRPHVPIVRRWGSLKLTEIRRRDVRELLDDVAQRAPVMANRTLALVRKVFNFAIEHEWLEMNPCHMVKRVTREKQRDRVLTEEELRAVWKALDAEPPSIAALFRLRLLTAQRGGEVLGAKWDEMDLTSAWWTIPGERSKNGLAHRVPLSPQALRILKDLRQTSEESLWVFPSPRKALPHIQHAQKAIERIVKASGVAFRGHDLRRTAASLMVGGGVPRLVVSKILNHVETGVTAVYDRHSYDPEKRSALDFWGKRIEAIIANKPGARLLAFRGRR